MDVIHLGKYQILDRNSDDRLNPKIDFIQDRQGTLVSVDQLDRYLKTYGLSENLSGSLRKLGFQFQWKLSLQWASQGNLQKLEKSLGWAEFYASQGKETGARWGGMKLWNKGVRNCMEAHYKKAQEQVQRGEFYREQLFEYRLCAFKGKVSPEITDRAEANLNFQYLWKRAEINSERGWVRSVENLIDQARKESQKAERYFPEAEARHLIQASLPKGIEVTFQKAEWFASLETAPEKTVRSLLKDAEEFSRRLGIPFDRSRADRILHILSARPARKPSLNKPLK